ncbi:T9SS type A sorting domain-containing protein [Winogradskyella schleiferi]|uniref:T9SS type A sorting domain-containing protein n=1 Tax=Winogradskyella schleiferi TaxID=2686078 RepID=UPI001E2B75C3|nr:T9SS type A sorting domain-containing protein [Winogradskyella schleiferi]
MDMWQDGATFARPKWGIYRSLNNIDDLQDEAALFNNFSIEEINPLANSDLESQAKMVPLFPNPLKDFVTFNHLEAKSYDGIQLFDSSGKKIKISNRYKTDTLDVTGLASGLYYITLLKSKRPIKILKCIVD